MDTRPGDGEHVTENARENEGADQFFPRRRSATARAPAAIHHATKPRGFQMGTSCGTTCTTSKLGPAAASDPHWAFPRSFHFSSADFSPPTADVFVSDFADFSPPTADFAVHNPGPTDPLGHPATPQITTSPLVHAAEPPNIF